MFRASGAMDVLTRLLDPVLGLIGFPAEVLPMAIIRPLTGSGSAALVVDMINRYGEDSIYVKMAAVMFGSTETTFYVIAVYFGAMSIKKTATRSRRGSPRTSPPCSSPSGRCGCCSADYPAAHRYLLLIYGDERAWDDETRESWYRESAELAHQLKAEGYYLGASPLQPLATATSIRVRQGKRLRTDGPFAETRNSWAAFSWWRRPRSRRRSRSRAGSRPHGWVRWRSGR